MKQLEALYTAQVERIKEGIERKLAAAAAALQRQREEAAAGVRRAGAAHAATTALKAELEAKLDLWRKQVCAELFMAHSCIHFIRYSTGTERPISPVRPCPLSRCLRCRARVSGGRRSGCGPSWRGDRPG